MLTPEQENKPSTDSVVNDKIVDVSLKSILIDLHGDTCIKKLISGVFLCVGLIQGLVLFYRGLSNPEGDFIASYEVFQFFIVSGLAGLGLSTVENLFKTKGKS